MSKRAESRKLQILADRMTREASANRPIFSEGLNERIRDAIGRHLKSRQPHPAGRIRPGVKMRQPFDGCLSSDRAGSGRFTGSGWTMGVAAGLCIAGAVTIAWVAGSANQIGAPNASHATIPASSIVHGPGGVAQNPLPNSGQFPGTALEGAALGEGVSSRSTDMAQSAQRLAAVPDWALAGIDRIAVSTMATHPWSDLNHDARLVTRMVIAPWPWYAVERGP